MKCKICGLEISEDFKCKVPKYDENGKSTLFDYAHPCCWKLYSQFKRHAEKYNKNNMICFAADMVYKALNPESTMCTPNALYIKIESELEVWEK